MLSPEVKHQCGNKASPIHPTRQSRLHPLQRIHHSIPCCVKAAREHPKTSSHIQVCVVDSKLSLAGLSCKSLSLISGFTLSFTAAIQAKGLPSFICMASLNSRWTHSSVLLSYGWIQLSMDSTDVCVETLKLLMMQVQQTVGL